MNLSLRKLRLNRIAHVKFFFKNVMAILLAITLASPACAFNWSFGSHSREVDLKRWGPLTAPVYGSSEAGVYAGRNCSPAPTS